MSLDLKKRRERRNLVLLGLLISFVVLFFVITIVKLGGNVANRPL
jgi:hypothetical protein|tara:strand:- start:130 stop:264 length:135 start_codon:yes stop_codon:yes gene_type:complete